MGGYRPLPSPVEGKSSQLATVLLVAVIACTAAARAGVGGHDHQRSASAADGAAIAKERVQSDLRNASIAEESYLTDYDHYTSSVADLYNEGLIPGGDDVVTVVAAVGDISYCLSSTAPELNGVTYYYNSQTGMISVESCAGGGE